MDIPRPDRSEQPKGAQKSTAPVWGAESRATLARKPPKESGRCANLITISLSGTVMLPARPGCIVSGFTPSLHKERYVIYRIGAALLRVGVLVLRSARMADRKYGPTPPHPANPTRRAVEGFAYCRLGRPTSPSAKLRITKRPNAEKGEASATTIAMAAPVGPAAPLARRGVRCVRILVLPDARMAPPDVWGLYFQIALRYRAI